MLTLSTCCDEANAISMTHKYLRHNLRHVAFRKNVQCYSESKGFHGNGMLQNIPVSVMHEKRMLHKTQMTDCHLPLPLLHTFRETTKVFIRSTPGSPTAGSNTTTF